jgi:hypothetical protein
MTKFTYEQQAILEKTPDPYERRELRRAFRRQLQALNIQDNIKRNKIWVMEKKRLEKEEHERELERDAFKDQEYYKLNRNYIKGYILIRDTFQYDLCHIPTELLKLIWGYVLDLLQCHNELKPIINFNNMICQECKLINPEWQGNCGMCNTDCDLIGSYIQKQWNVNSGNLLLCHHVKKIYYRIHRHCLLSAGLTRHNYEKCHIGYKKGCSECIDVYYNQLESVEMNYEVLDLGKNVNKFCQLFKYVNISHHNVMYTEFTKYDKNELSNAKEEIPKINGDKYHIKNRKSFDIFMKHINLISLDPAKCIICLNRTKFSCDGFHLCSDMECHLTFGVTIKKLGIFDRKIPKQKQIRASAEHYYPQNMKDDFSNGSDPDDDELYH